MSEWISVKNRLPPSALFVHTKRDGENGVNVCARNEPDDFGDIEWYDLQGRTTVTHHSFLPPTHWRPYVGDRLPPRAGGK